MITAIDVWKFIHILLFVYWLGADLGVFLLALTSKRSELSFAERALALKMAMVIDVMPRLSFALMFPVGLELAAAKGYVEPTALVRAVSWLISAVWVGIVIGMTKLEGKPVAHSLAKANAALHAILLVVVVGIGASSVLGHGPFPAGWLGWKILLFGLIFFCGIMIDREFKPMVPAFTRLATEGSKPAIERDITRAVNGAVVWVLALYALVAGVAFLGTAKPF
jgi:hypothetical protein